MPENHKRHTNRKVIFIPLIIVIVLAAVGLGYSLMNQRSQRTNQPTTQSSILNTSSVRRGSLILSATGAGTLVAGKKTNLSFPIEGKVAAVNIKVGETVSAGQVLAELKDINSLQASYNTARLELEAAEQELEDLRNSAGANLAIADLAVAEAEKALLDARSAVVEEGWARCDQETSNAYYERYLRAQNYLESLGDGGGSREYYLTSIVPAKNNALGAYNAYLYCAGYTQYEINSSHANLALAEAELEEANSNLQNLQENGGIDPAAFAEAQSKVTNAQIAFEQAAKDLDGASMKAPFDGTILSVAGEAGEEVDISSFITVADLRHPEIEFSVDETDLDKVAVNAEARVTFDAIPETVFHGTVSLVNPSLENSGGYQVLTGIIQLELAENNDTSLFIEGMSATIEIIKGSAENILLVPVEALHDLGDGQYSVFVVGEDGQPRLRVVEVGLMGDTFVEITKGLQMGETVSTGAVETD